MKSIFKTLALMAMSIAMVGLVACDPEPDPEPDTTPSVDPTVASTTYAFNYQNRSLEPGQTVYFYPTAQEENNDWATVRFFIENKTSDNVDAYIKIEKVEGPDAMNDLSVCFGETCKTGTCPWKYGPISLAPGVNNDLPILFDYSPSKVGNKTVYMIMIGTGENLLDPQVMYLDVAAHAQ